MNWRCASASASVSFGSVSTTQPTATIAIARRLATTAVRRISRLISLASLEVRGDDELTNVAHHSVRLARGPRLERSRGRSPGPRHVRGQEPQSALVDGRLPNFSPGTSERQENSWPPAPCHLTPRRAESVPTRKGQTRTAVRPPLADTRAALSRPRRARRRPRPSRRSARPSDRR